MKMKNLKTLTKKEFLFILRDSKSLISASILSIILLPMLMFVLQFIQDAQRANVESREISVGVSANQLNSPVVEFLKNNETLELNFVESKDFTSDFREKLIDGFLKIEEDQGKFVIEYIYDQNSNVSIGALQFVIQAIEVLKLELQSEFLIENDIDPQDLETLAFSSSTLQSKVGQAEQSGIVLFLVPYFIFLAIVQGAMQFAIELTAGEKERNTLATTLSLNVKSWEIAMSKIMATLAMSIYTMILQFISVLIALVAFPDVFGGGGEGSFVVNGAILGNLFLVLLPLSLLSSAIMILVGIYARSQKEAGIYASPILMLALVIGFSASAFDASTPIFVFGIPFVGHIASIKLVLLNAFTLSHFLIVTISTVFFLALILFVIVKIFSREEVLFRV